MILKLSSETWSQLTGIEVIDPDGWNRKGDFDKSWEEEITFSEFLTRCEVSTVLNFYDRNHAKANIIGNIDRLLG